MAPFLGFFFSMNRSNVDIERFLKLVFHDRSPSAQDDVSFFRILEQTIFRIFYFLTSSLNFRLHHLVAKC